MTFRHFCYDFSAFLESIYWNKLIAVSVNFFDDISELGTTLNSSKILRAVVKKMKPKVSVGIFKTIYQFRTTSTSIFVWTPLTYLTKFSHFLLLNILNLTPKNSQIFWVIHLPTCLLRKHSWKQRLKISNWRNKVHPGNYQNRSS